MRKAVLPTPLGRKQFQQVCLVPTLGIRKRSLSTLSTDSGYSERQLRRWFSEYLEHVPECVVGINKGTHLLIDGTWLPDGRCVIVYRDQDRRSTLYYNICDGENEYEYEIASGPGSNP